MWATMQCIAFPPLADGLASRRAVVSIASTATASTVLPASAAVLRPSGAPPAQAAQNIVGAQSYYVNPERTLLVASDRERERSMLRSEFLVVGEHHNYKIDHAMERNMLAAMANEAQADGVPLILGLEMVERAFQQPLDDYCAHKLSDDALFQAVEWDKRWGWPWDQYLPILQLARQRGVRIVALNTDTEVLRRVPIEGLETLSADRRADLVPDAEGFISTTKASRCSRGLRTQLMANG